eukprot:GHVS01080456.1.p1 GENE.GHVS01080456.1~~GHVS01080456.1.p1  ORF type:complete len:448 (+),score=66.96 GHVS01080456.1:111-1454(+)
MGLIYSTAVSVGSCCLTAACTACCSSFCSVTCGFLCQLPPLSRRKAKWLHLGTFLALVTFVFFLKLFLDLYLFVKFPFLPKVTAIGECLQCTPKNPLLPQHRCLIQQVTFRFGFLLTAFFLLASVASLNKHTCQVFHQRLVPLKCMFLIFGFILLLFVPNGFFAVFAQFCQLLSFPFLILQTICILGFAYSCHTYLHSYSQMRAHVPRWHRAAVQSAVAVPILAATGLMIWGCYLRPDNSTSRPLLFAVLIGCAINMIYSLTPIAQHSGLVASSFATALAVFLMSHAPPLPWVNAWAVDDSAASPSVADDAACIALAALALVVCSGDCSAHRPAPPPAIRNELDARFPLVDEEEEAVEEEGRSGDVCLETWDKREFLPFNLSLLLGCLYCFVVITSWRPAVQNDGTPASPAAAVLPFWYFTSSSLLAVLCYSWTLLAPLLLPHRDFS